MADFFSPMIIGAGLGVALGWVGDQVRFFRAKRYWQKRSAEYRLEIDAFMAEVLSYTNGMTIRLPITLWSKAHSIQSSLNSQCSVADMLRQMGYRLSAYHA